MYLACKPALSTKRSLELTFWLIVALRLLSTRTYAFNISLCLSARSSDGCIFISRNLTMAKSNCSSASFSHPRSAQTVAPQAGDGGGPTSRIIFVPTWDRCHLPFHTGGRFSRNDLIPSRQSSVRFRLRKRSRVSLWWTPGGHSREP